MNPARVLSYALLYGIIPRLIIRWATPLGILSNGWGFGRALHRPRLIAVRAIPQSFLADQLQQPGRSASIHSGAYRWLSSNERTVCNVPMKLSARGLTRPTRAASAINPRIRL